MNRLRLGAAKLAFHASVSLDLEGTVRSPYLIGLAIPLFRAGDQGQPTAAVRATTDCAKSVALQTPVPSFGKLIGQPRLPPNPRVIVSHQLLSLGASFASFHRIRFY